MNTSPQVFPKLYAVRDGKHGRHFIRRDSETGSHVATVELSSFVRGAPDQATYAARLVGAFNAYEDTTAALLDLTANLLALADTELSLDEERNRTPGRMAMRQTVYKAIVKGTTALKQINQVP